MPYIVTVTRLEETQKDVSTLLRAYALLVQQHGVTEPMLIVGQGRHRPQLEALAAQLGITDRVRFMGFVANPLPLVRQARLLVLSSRFEGLPTVLIEGLMLGQVMVSTECPTGPREILNQGVAGLLVPVGDVGQLAAAMLNALRDDVLRQQLREGVEKHSAVFGVPAFRQRLLERVKGIEPSS